MTDVLSSEHAGHTGGVSSPPVSSLPRAFGPHAVNASTNAATQSEADSLIAATKTPRYKHRQSPNECRFHLKSAVVHVFARPAHVSNHDANEHARLQTIVCTACAPIRSLRMSHFEKMNQRRITRSQLTLSNAI